MRSPEECRDELIAIRDELTSILHMSGLERRFSHIVDDLDAIVDGRDGLSELISELRDDGDERPGWTRPFASPKYVTRKDI